MIVINDLGKFRKAILWKNEYPSLFNEVDHEFETTIHLTDPVATENKKFAVELKLPRNSSYFAFLGAEYTPSNTSELKLKINLSNNVEVLYHSELGLKEEIYLGIPYEYANSIINSAKESIVGSNWQYAGSITFNLGAHSLIGSSEAVFSKVTKIIIALLINGLSTDSSLNDELVIRTELDK